MYAINKRHFLHERPDRVHDLRGFFANMSSGENDSQPNRCSSLICNHPRRLHFTLGIPSHICALLPLVSLASSRNRKWAGIEPKRAQSIDFKRFRKCRGANQNILKTREIVGKVPSGQIILFKVNAREEIGFGREENLRSLIFHESKRRLHKPHLHSKYQTPPKPNTNAASLFNS